MCICTDIFQLFQKLTFPLLQLISFVTGFFLQDIVRALVFGLLGTALTFLVVVPPWPMYNRRPVKWLKVQKNQTSTVTINGEEVEL